MTALKGDMMLRKPSEQSRAVNFDTPVVLDDDYMMILDVVMMKTSRHEGLPAEVGAWRAPTLLVNQ